MGEAPVLVEVTRGGMVESRHRGAFAVVDADGGVVESGGDIERLVYPRSAIKLIQSLPLIETGAADAFALGATELALACASHNGESRHVERVAAWLGRIGRSPADLECGAHPPNHAASAMALVRAGLAPSPLHNNCSGKHAGMLTTCLHLGEPTRGYVRPDHPHQRRVVRVFEEICGVDLSAAPRGIDGCGLPQIGLPLVALARGIARFGAPDRLAPARAAACRRLAAAILAEPFLLAGTGRFGTRATELAAGKAIVKTGAEGVYVAALPLKELALAVKIEDGAARAAEVALARLLEKHAGLDAAQIEALGALLRPSVANAAGLRVGEIRPAGGW